METWHSWRWEFAAKPSADATLRCCTAAGGTATTVITCREQGHWSRPHHLAPINCMLRKEPGAACAVREGLSSRCDASALGSEREPGRASPTASPSPCAWARSSSTGLRAWGGRKQDFSERCRLPAPAIAQKERKRFPGPRFQTTLSAFCRMPPVAG